MFFDRPTMRNRVTAEPLFTGQFSLEFYPLPNNIEYHGPVSIDFDFNGQTATFRYDGTETQEGEGGEAHYRYNVYLYNVSNEYKTIKYTIYYYTPGYSWTPEDSSENVSKGWYPVSEFTGQMTYVKATQFAPAHWVSPHISDSGKTRNLYWHWWHAVETAHSLNYKVVFSFS